MKSFTLFIFLLGVMLMTDGCGSKNTTTVDGVTIEDLQVGTGASPMRGKPVTIHYTGTLTDGKTFDSSRERNQPFSFVLGAGEVIPGMEIGVDGMKVGGRRRITIPPELAYGSRGAGGVIPPNATIIFDIELLGVE